MFRILLLSSSRSNETVITRLTRVQERRNTLARRWGLSVMVMNLDEFSIDTHRIETAIDEFSGLPREKVGQSDRYSSRLRGGGNVARIFSKSGVGKSSYDTRDGEDERLSRNLDQIGAGNLLRGAGEGSSYDGRWSRRNLDQIGGGNLLREAESRDERNLDSIGGGNLVRGVNRPLSSTDNNPRFDRNLDQIGGGNLVRGLARSIETR